MFVRQSHARPQNLDVNVGWQSALPYATVAPPETVSRHLVPVTPTLLVETDALSPVLAGVVATRVAYNDELVELKLPRSRTIFHSALLPPISPERYIERLATHAHCSPSCLVMAMYLIDRLALSDLHYRMTSANVHRLFITAFMIAIKYLEDSKFEMGHFEVVAGIPRSQLIRLEADMLRLLNFYVGVSAEELRIYQTSLIEEAFLSAHPSCLRGRERLLRLGCRMPSLMLEQSMSTKRYSISSPRNYFPSVIAHN